MCLCVCRRVQGSGSLWIPRSSWMRTRSVAPKIPLSTFYYSTHVLSCPLVRNFFFFFLLLLCQSLKVSTGAGKYYTFKSGAGLIKSACFPTEHSYPGTPVISVWCLLFSCDIYGSWGCMCGVKGRVCVSSLVQASFHHWFRVTSHQPFCSRCCPPDSSVSRLVRQVCMLLLCSGWSQTCY